MGFRMRLPNALVNMLPGSAQAATALVLTAVLLVLAALAPSHVVGIGADWQVVASLKAIGAVVSPQAFTA